ncbi:hypothetical protein CONPUDRAFT_169132 [Coniophora puteana RWD-64-598 SS2]|uniref:Uncharacterized protein n=1 Tax=Coniophora puteana (strain RWD-64-598) TaxID=741705 RepID=A0A5M3M9N4_CONPW|nr:uncharacterized protein CONPUDRAFT_169132 [Coniophora puteana RWD-64-598 SS2]EIW75889.1 hypothetical protein CONPUDRAFT_169132 [Coniophora puteana RWD-64-598 SS2]
MCPRAPARAFSRVTRALLAGVMNFGETGSDDGRTSAGHRVWVIWPGLAGSIQSMKRQGRKSYSQQRSQPHGNCAHLLFLIHNRHKLAPAHAQTPASYPYYPPNLDPRAPAYPRARSPPSFSPFLAITALTIPRYPLDQLLQRHPHGIRRPPRPSDAPLAGPRSRSTSQSCLACSAGVGP